MKHGFLLLILISFISCQNKVFKRAESINRDEKHDLINQAILEQLRGNNTYFNRFSDTINIDSFLINPCPHGRFTLNETDTSLGFFFNFYTITSDLYGKYFTPDEKDFIKSQLEDDTTSCWDIKQIHAKNFSDSTLFNDSIISYPDINVWLLFQEEPYDYFSISNPLYNRAYNKSLVTTELYLKNYYIVSVLEFKKKLDYWLINSKYSLLFKLDIENCTDTNYLKVAYSCDSGHPVLI